jgi:hypothetical protein
MLSLVYENDKILSDCTVTAHLIKLVENRALAIALIKMETIHRFYHLVNGHCMCSGILLLTQNEMFAIN